MYTRSSSLIHSLLLTFLLCLAALPASADATLTIENVVAQTDAVEIPLYLRYTGRPVLALEFDLVFDPAELDFTGPFSPISGSIEVADQVFLRNNVKEPGRVAFVVSGLNDANIPQGLFVTLSFNLVDPVDGAALLLSAQDAQAADINAQPIALNIEDGSVAVGCPDVVPSASISASDGQAGGVTVLWEMASGAAAYRVYRAKTADEADATPISDWIIGTQFFDASAIAPRTVTSTGCSPQTRTINTTYHYWVAVRDANFCVSPLTGPDVGFRGSGTIAKANASTLYYESFLPNFGTIDGARIASADTPLALRLHASAPIDPNSLWGSLTQSDGVLISLEWQPNDAEETDGWLIATPGPEGWPLGDTLLITGGAADIAGREVGPFSYPVRIDQVRATDMPQWDRYTADPVPYAQSQEYFLAIPRDNAANGFELQYFYADGQESQWRPADQILGLLAQAPELVTIDGADHYRILLQHGGQLRIAKTPAQQPNQSGNSALLLFSLSLTPLLIARRRAALNQ